MPNEKRQIEVRARTDQQKDTVNPCQFAAWIFHQQQRDLDPNFKTFAGLFLALLQERSVFTHVHKLGSCEGISDMNCRIAFGLRFVSHAWLEPVCNFVACLKRHASLRQLSEQTAYWVCAYANNQHQLEAEICHNPRKTSFYRAIKMCAGVLLVLDNNATPFTRSFADN